MSNDSVTPNLIKRYSAPVPRYTSYPPAPHFSGKVDAEVFRGWLAALRPGAKLSLYSHIPFCHALCWYCGCSTKATSRAEPTNGYLQALLKEIEHVAGIVPRDHEVTHIHWGGGSPNILSEDSISELAGTARRHFNISKDCDFAVEIDPRNLTEDQVDAFAKAGVTRVSVGVQDFDPKVQEAINRFQPFEMTKRAIELFRAHGVRSVNMDLVYGLPYQTRASIQRTMEQTLSLRPDRIAVFGYAHLPSRFRHQRLISDDALPDAVERYAQSQRLARILTGAGYVRVGLDHYALPGDSLASGNVARNFQGYTSDTAEALIGFGASAISKLPQGYAQNAVPTPDYQERIEKTGLATVRGLALSEDDRMRADVIERLMCDFTFSRSELRQDYGAAAEPVLHEADHLIEADHDGFIERTDDGFVVRERGRPFIRTICACFDAYLGQSNAQHAIAV